MAKKDAEELARAQRIADGKERNKRGALDLDDDDFDDDWGVSKRPKQKQQRVDNMTTAELSALHLVPPSPVTLLTRSSSRAAANEETQAFAMHITEGLTHEVKAGELDFLKGPEDDGEEEYEEDDDEEETQMLPPQPRISVHEATRMAVEQSKQVRSGGSTPRVSGLADALSLSLYSARKSSLVNARQPSTCPRSDTRVRPCPSTRSRVGQPPKYLS